MLDQEHQKLLLQLAREAIVAHLEERKIRIAIPKEPIYRTKKGVFVTLHKGSRLRGCIGYIRPYFSLFGSVKELAVSAAFNDPRFPPLREDELEKTTIEISVLSDLIPVDRKKLDEIEIGRDGVYIDGSFGSGLLLPQVAVEQGWDRTTFLRAVSEKAGLPPISYMSEAYNLFRFSAQIFSESR